jgi:cell division protein FtsB
MGWISDLFKEIPLSVNLQSKLEILEEKYVILEAENKQLKSENEKLNIIITKYESRDKTSPEELEKIAKDSWGAHT